MNSKNILDYAIYRQHLTSFGTQINSAQIKNYFHDMIMFEEMYEHLQKLNTKTAEQTKVISEQSQQISEQSNEIENLRNQILGYENSFSWRVTKPLRKIKSAFKKLLHGKGRQL
jgi:uncharacterized coiled-coil protein SlyX